MNKNDIIAALVTKNITPSDLNDAIDLYTSFLSIGEKMLAVGMEVTIAKKDIPPLVGQISRRLNVIASKVLEFMEKNKPNAAGSNWPNDSKIGTIKSFREITGAGLADAKWATEMIFIGSSNTFNS